MLETEIRRLIDEDAIRKCVTRYARGLDRHNTQQIKSAFHEDGTDRHGNDLRNPSELAKWGNALHSTHTRAHQHFLSNHTIDLDGDTAHVETYVHFVLWRKTEPLVDISGGRYLDRLERRDGQWGIVDRVVVVDWAAEAPQGTDSKGTLHAYPRGEWHEGDLSYRRPLNAADSVELETTT